MAMARNTMNNGADTAARARAGARAKRIVKSRAWIQTAFLGVWLMPVGRWLHSFPACVFHCYACPLSAFACPVGLMANYAAAFSVWATVPWLLIGVLALVGGAVGSLVCGWACPFGLLQDLLAKIRKRKFSLLVWVGHMRYVVLVGLVLFLPWYLGRRGILYEEQTISIYRLCPAGALEASLWYSIWGVLTGSGWLMSWYKGVILVSFLGAAILIHRPWCRMFCPLGGLLALFNRVSFFTCGSSRPIVSIAICAAADAQWGLKLTSLSTRPVAFGASNAQPAARFNLRLRCRVARQAGAGSNRPRNHLIWLHTQPAHSTDGLVG